MSDDPATTGETVQPAGWPRPKGYANAVRVPSGCDLLVLAGQIGWDEREQLVGPGFVAQFRQALRNVLTLVQAAGGSAGDIVRLTMYCTDRQAYLSSLAEVGVAYRDVLGRHYPTMSMVEVAALMEDGAVIEIEALAALRPRVPAHGT